MPFKPGQSGNPDGARRKSNKVAGMCRAHTEEAVKALIESLADPKNEVRIKAAEAILNRGWGKPQEFVEVSGDEENPLSHKFTVEFVRAKSENT